MEAKPWAADECHSPPVTSRLGSEVIKSLWSSPGIRWIDTDIKGTPYSSSLLQPMLEGQTGLTSKYFNIQIFHLDKQTEKKKKSSRNSGKFRQSHTGCDSTSCCDGGPQHLVRKKWVSLGKVQFLSCKIVQCCRPEVTGCQVVIFLKKRINLMAATCCWLALLCCIFLRYSLPKAWSPVSKSVHNNVKLNLYCKVYIIITVN